MTGQHVQIRALMRINYASGAYQQPIEQINAQYIFSDMLKYAMAFRQTFLRTKFAAHWLPKINTFSKIFA